MRAGSHIWPDRGSQDSNDKSFRDANPELILWRSAKGRSTRDGTVFNIDVSDVIIPDCCPYLKTEFVSKTMYAASLDRIDPKKGYVKGNVEVISRKANVMKNDATVQELLEFAYTILERH